MPWPTVRRAADANCCPSPTVCLHSAQRTSRVLANWCRPQVPAGISAFAAHAFSRHAALTAQPAVSGGENGASSSAALCESNLANVQAVVATDSSTFVPSDSPKATHLHLSGTGVADCSFASIICNSPVGWRPQLWYTDIFPAKLRRLLPRLAIRMADLSRSPFCAQTPYVYHTCTRRPLCQHARTVLSRACKL